LSFNDFVMRVLNMMGVLIKAGCWMICF